MRGRKPKPTKLKLLLGNPGHRAINTSEPELPSGTGGPPDHLDSIALGEWARVEAILVSAGVLTEGDRAVLSLYCSAWSRWVKAEKTLAKSSELLKSESGGVYQNPYLAISNRAAENVAKLASMLGLDPSSRSRLTTSKPQSSLVSPKPKDPFAVTG